MRRRWGCLLLAWIAATVGCVDGTTPDCSTPSSGCYPVEAGGNDGEADAADASFDASEADAADAGDAAMDATDAATDAAID